MAQLVVIVDVLVAQRDPRYALAHHGAQRMHHQLRIPVVHEARGDPIEQPDRLLRVAQKKRPGIRGDCPAVERRHHPASLMAFKFKLSRGTVCVHRPSSRT